MLLIGSGASAEIDLIGSWHVLVHYHEVGAESGESGGAVRWEWEDRLWVFEAEGERLRFTEYPIVAFDDRSGRYERGVSGEWERVAGRWEPDEGQLREIAGGLAVNPRGSRSKTLRTTGPGRFSSARPGGYDSARFVSFETVVEVDTGGLAPRIEIRDRLDSSAVQGRDGVTRYEGERIASDGLRVEGSYDRDGALQGRFVMRRAGVARTDEREEPEQSERELTYERFYRQLGRELQGNEQLPESIRGGSSREERAALRERIVAVLEDGYRNQGNDPQPHAPQVQALADRILELYAQGRTRDEIARMLQDGRLRP